MLSLKIEAGMNDEIRPGQIPDVYIKIFLSDSDGPPVVPWVWMDSCQSCGGSCGTILGEVQPMNAMVTNIHRRL